MFVNLLFQQTLDKDIERIKEFYRGIKGRFPEKGVV
jgi:hypothetical protein